MPHTFYLWQGQGIKPWVNRYAQLPQNHILLDGSEGQIKPDMKFDMVLSQNKFGQFQVAQQIAQRFNIPLISLEHTLPMHTWHKKQIDAMTAMQGSINVFISEYSIKQWGFDPKHPSVRIVEHAVDTSVFQPSIYSNQQFGTNGVISTVNDWINRDWCCNFSLFKKLVLDKGLPYKVVGDTPGFSEPAKDIAELVKHYHDGTVYFNTSTISPVPTAMLEAMACGLPVVSTATCQIPDIIKNEVNGYCSNDEDYLADKLKFCLENPTHPEILEICKNAVKTIEERFSIKTHVKKWLEIFDSVYGKGYDV
jgi:glycosyltransferase involved in cell wall biosynthesis